MATYRGSCHCGRVQFRVTGELREVIVCNCSICSQKGLLHWIVEPAQFELISGKDELASYRFDTGIADHTFCKTCGVQPFYTPRSDPDRVDVNLRCLAGVDLGPLPWRDFDGQHWEMAIERAHWKQAQPADVAATHAAHRSSVGAGSTRETYTHGHAPATLRQHGLRTAEEAAAFLLPELQRGMRLLDVGCGPGSITRGLAERLAPGEVVGLDLSPDALAVAREDAVARGIHNLRYELGSVYELPFPDASFDAVFAHQVLQHLREPRAALVEMLRVLKPRGLLAARDVDWGSVAYAPRDAWLDRFVDVHLRTWKQNGGEPCMGRRLRALFNSVAASDLKITATDWCYASLPETRAWGESYAERLLTSPMGARAVEYGYASREDVEAMAAAFRTWAVHPDAFWAFIHVAALAKKS
jgi:2-polyprenyl-3-methyl-5-hydroxy-6-metoxy-1,4-benzoquinol methylase